MALKDSQTKMYDHSEVKVRLLKLYLERYLNIMNSLSYIKAIHLFDMFCGEGVYYNGGKGSPLQILEVIKSIHEKSNGNKTMPINCLFNDIEKWKTDKLQNEIASKALHNKEMGKLEFSNEDYKNLLPNTVQFINKLKNEKAFVFIDPYGYKEIRMSDIRNLLTSKSSEVLLFLPTQFMFRFEEKGTPESLKEFISEIVPKDQWPKSETGIDFIEKLNDGFQNALGDDFFVDSFVITRDKNQFFCLFYFTSHIYGFDRMQDAKWEIDEEEGRGWQYEDDTNLFGGVAKTPNTFILERKLKEFLVNPKTNSDVYKFTLHQRHKPSHTNQVLLKLQAEKKIEVVNKDGSTARKSSFYLNYKAHKETPDKIQMKIII
ncbi:MAG: three-Cys-motif partner protein TcmP [Bacteroidetes bacterium]|nr:three-Cys-motif partner protein TcmP [Bacteroidota bacterium]